MVSAQWTGSVPPCARSAGVEKSDPVNGWPLRAISLWDVMMMMMTPPSKLINQLTTEMKLNDKQITMIPKVQTLCEFIF